MTKILLCCAGGMSTSFIVNKMRDEAIKQGIDAEIKAVGAYEVETIWKDWDVVLIGPQVRFEYSRFQKLFNGERPVGLMSPQLYGTMDGKKILEMALELVKNHEK